ncbi:MAG TPA: histidine phosphatase family protein [Phenylobacterium sp.]|nr:histidine phosphatase family protein [Phenylobacterium sp.]
MIYLVRHGETEFNLAGRYQGGLDSALTPRGEAQARAAGARLRELTAAEPFELVSSPLGRAWRTAQIVAEVAGLPAPVAAEGLREVTLGSWDGLTGEDIDHAWPGARDGYTRWNWWFASPDGERYAGFAGRLADWMAEACRPERRIVAVTHGVASRVLRGLYACLPKDEALKLDVPQDAFFRLEGGKIERIDCG